MLVKLTLFYQYFTSSFFVQKSVVQLLSKFGFVNFWQNNIGAKAACKMLVKLTTGVNFSKHYCSANCPKKLKPSKCKFKLHLELLVHKITS
jgi:hypothetical protein